jgi:DNA-binding CsgD family transcriptional regulator/tetratricopeptide (TPR) repeat protein
MSDLLRNIAERRPTLLVLEDLHWADRGTLELLLHLARHVQDTRVLFLGTYRDVEVDLAHPLSATLVELRRVRELPRLLLHGLSPTEVQRMVDAVAGEGVRGSLVAAVHRRTEGNPLFVQEALRYLAEEGLLLHPDDPWQRTGESLAEMPIPAGLRDVIGKRLSHLSPECARLLTLAAVIGRDFRLDTLHQVAGLGEEPTIAELEEATRVGVLEEKTRLGVVGYRFAHALFRQTLYEGLSAPRRVRAHQEVAQVLEAQYADRLEEHAAELAEHFAQSPARSDLERAVRYRELAAGRATAVYAYGEAARLLEQALEIQEVLAPDDMRRCELLLALGGALMPDGKPLRVLEEVAPRALALAEQGRDERLAVRACRLAMDAFARSGARTITLAPEWHRWAERYERYAGANTTDRVRLDVDRGEFLHTVGREAEARATLARALALARQLAAPDELFYAASFSIYYAMPPAYEEARVRLAEEAAGWPLDGASARTLAYLYLYSGYAYFDWGNRSAAEECWRRLAELASRSQDTFVIAFSALAGGQAAGVHGRLAEAVAAGEQQIVFGDQLGAPISGRTGAATVSYRSLLHLGRGEEALELLALARQAAGIGDEPAILRPRRALALAHLGRHEQARSLLDAIVAERKIGPEEDDNAATTDLLPLLETALLLEERELVTLLSGRLSIVPGLLKTHGGTQTSVARHLGAAAALLGRPAEARSFYEQALEVCARVGFRPEIALTHLELAELLLRWYPEEGSRADDHLGVAIEELQSMSMQPALERALRIRDQHQISVSGSRPAHPAGLTEREMEVLRLIALGNSSREIAQALVLSVRTVERHTSNIYMKLGIQTRTQATALALTRGLVPRD